MKPFTLDLLVWYIYPIIAIIGAKFIISFFHLNQKYQLKAPDIATPLLMIGLYFFSTAALGRSVIAYYFISIILLGMGLVLIHAYFFDEVHYGRLFKMYWRMTFLLTIFLYGVLLCWNIFALVA